MANPMVLGRVSMPAAFRIPGFAGLWVSGSLASFSRVVIQIALSWITLEVTGSPFMVGVVGAARMAPQLVFGIPAGALADSMDRRLMIVLANGSCVGLLLASIALALGGLLSAPMLILMSALFGIVDTVRMSASQAYAYDLVRSTRATSGMALSNLGGQLFSMLGGLAGGYALAGLGGPVTLAGVAVAVLVAIAALYLGGAAAPVEKVVRDGAPAEGRPAGRRTGVDLRRALTLVTRKPILAILALSIILAEIFGFATQTLLPTFARDVFEVGAAGLGVMMATRAAGGSLGLLVLSRLGAEGRSGVIFVSTAGLFGLALLLFTLSPTYELALVLLAISGFGASVMDTLGQTLLQRNADERERGAAMGLWVFSVGFGPVGHLALGAGADAFGAPATQAVSGVMLMIVAAGMALHAPLRRAR
ncbi:MAG: MFS transporter [Chloroflexi bacterium]|nr:MFS transporter [Chloroflexota bacterium]